MMKKKKKKKKNLSSMRCIKCLHMSCILDESVGKKTGLLGLLRVETITDAAYADDIALLANTPTQAESLLQCQQQAAGSISLHVNIEKTEYMCFN